MRKIHVDNLKEGMVISKPIYTSSGIILLTEGMVLTDRYIEKIVSGGFEFVYINDEVSKGIKLDELIKEETKVETKKVLQECLKRMKSGYFNTGGNVIRKVEEMIKEILLNPRVMVSLQDIRAKNDYLLLHAINVCVISVLLGKKMNYTDIQLKHLAIGALLHDMGKINIQFDFSRYREDYLEKELQVYKLHIQEGYEMIQAIPETTLMSANIVRMHHENYDGSGYPMGLKGDAIHEFAKIVAVANEYDNLLYNQSFDSKLKHYEIIEVIIAKSFTAFDPHVVRVFSNSISPYPLGSGVVLSNGKTGIISNLNSSFPTRPVVRVVDFEDMHIIEEVDLSKIPSLLIMDEIDIDK